MRMLVCLILVSTMIGCNRGPAGGIKDKAAVAPAGVGGKLDRATTPEQAVANLNAAAGAGDTKNFLAHLGGPIRDLLETRGKVDSLHETLIQTLNSKFGKDLSESKSPTMTESLLKTFPKVEVRAKELKGDSKALLTVWFKETVYREIAGKGNAPEVRIIEEKWEAMKRLDTWTVAVVLDVHGNDEAVMRKDEDGKEVKVTLRTLSPEHAKLLESHCIYEADIATKVLAASEKVVREVKAGKYQNRDEALEAFDAAEATIRKQFPPATSGGKSPGK